LDICNLEIASVLFIPLIQRKSSRDFKILIWADRSRSKAGSTMWK